ncbi:hypothetical protein [Streptococcus sobrinus]|uniref:hypothetical protein n=1 Tax=Streptococcus sobrinus TaxID=1310 RepID=UPI0003659CDE|nr:hypothetical protein [Streptococcus sobrinus]
MTYYKRRRSCWGSLFGTIGAGIGLATVLVANHREDFECGYCYKIFTAKVSDYFKGSIEGAKTDDWRLHYNTMNSRPLICPHCHRLSQCHRV